MRLSRLALACIVVPLAIVPACTCSKKDDGATGAAGAGGAVAEAPTITATTTTTTTAPTATTTITGIHPLATVNRPPLTIPSGQVIRRIPPPAKP